MIHFSNTIDGNPASVDRHIILLFTRICGAGFLWPSIIQRYHKGPFLLWRWPGNLCERHRGRSAKVYKLCGVVGLVCPWLIFMFSMLLGGAQGILFFTAGCQRSLTVLVWRHLWLLALPPVKFPFWVWSFLSSKNSAPGLQPRFRLKTGCGAPIFPGTLPRTHCKGALSITVVGSMPLWRYCLKIRGPIEVRREQC